MSAYFQMGSQNREALRRHIRKLNASEGRGMDGKGIKESHSSAVHSSALIVRAAPGGCEYLVRIDGVQRECGAPATHQLNRARGLRYCETHAHEVRVRGKKDVRELQPHELKQA